ncbi:hypothetical protein ACVIEM_006435 [Rhizobium leguminosarum]
MGTRISPIRRGHDRIIYLAAHADEGHRPAPCLDGARPAGARADRARWRPADRCSRFRAEEPQSCHRRLERRIFRRKQGDRAARRSVVRRQGWAFAAPRHLLGRLGRWPLRYLQAPRRRHLARWQAVYLGRCSLLGAQRLEAAAESRPPGLCQSSSRRYARRLHRHLPLLQADAVPADPQRAACRHQRRRQAYLRRHRYRHQSGEQHAHRHRSVQVRRNTSPANITG